MVRVYRIEDRTGSGPWSGEYHVRQACDETRSRRPGEYPLEPSDMPGPCDQSERAHSDRLEADRNTIFGWRTKGQMRHWFKPAICRALRERGGYVLNEYDVPEATFSHHQATFKRSTARLVATHKLC